MDLSNNKNSIKSNQYQHDNSTGPSWRERSNPWNRMWKGIKCKSIKSHCVQCKCTVESKAQHFRCIKLNTNSFKGSNRCNLLWRYSYLGSYRLWHYIIVMVYNFNVCDNVTVLHLLFSRNHCGSGIPSLFSVQYVNQSTSSHAKQAFY